MDCLTGQGAVMRGNWSIVPDDVVIGVRPELDYVLLRLRGRLTLRSVPRVREATVKSLLRTGRVVIDLSHLRAELVKISV